MSQRSDATPLLYTYRRCPYAMRARMALLQAGVAYQAHELTSLRDKPAEMLALSPKGTVPVLVLPTGDVLEQSLDIMRWALRRRATRKAGGRGRKRLHISRCGPFVMPTSSTTWTATNTRSVTATH